LGSSVARANPLAIMINPAATAQNFIPLMKPVHAPDVNIRPMGRISPMVSLALFPA
jgi:hypothetical protein